MLIMFVVYFVKNEAIIYTDLNSKEESLITLKNRVTVVYKQDYSVRK
jgi:hypothetical protein